MKEDGPFIYFKSRAKTLPLYPSLVRIYIHNMQLPFGRYTGLCTQQWERTHAKSIIGDGEGGGGGWGGVGGVNVESHKGAFAVLNLWGSCDENCFKAALVFKGAGHLEVCLAREEVTEGEK